MLEIKIKKIYKFIAVIGLLIFLHFIKILAPIENVIISIINPLASGIYSVSSDLRVAVDERTDKKDLLATMKILEQKVNQLIVANTQLKLLEEENKKLRQYLKFSTKNKFNYILANVISQGTFTDLGERKRIIMIDKGLRDGLLVGLGAVDSQGIIVGKVIEVKENIAKVRLTIDSDCKLAVTVQNQDYLNKNRGAGKTIGVTEGELGLTIKMNFIPQIEIIKAGDIVVTSGLEENIPAGLVVGKIIQVDKDSNKVWQSAVVEPLVDLDDLTIVSVLLP